MARERNARHHVASPPPRAWFQEVLDEFWHGLRNPPPRRVVPRLLDGLLHKEPEGPPTAASKQAALDEAGLKLDFSTERLLAYCAAHHDIRSAAFFGSILRKDFLETSDVDILLDCDDIKKIGPHRDAFREIFGRDVDVRSLRWLRNHYNPLGRAVIWNSKQTFYEREQ